MGGLASRFARHHVGEQTLADRIGKSAPEAHKSLSLLPVANRTSRSDPIMDPSRWGPAWCLKKREVSGHRRACSSRAPLDLACRSSCLRADPYAALTTDVIRFRRRSFRASIN